jgi:hypothetical protein
MTCRRCSARLWRWLVQQSWFSKRVFSEDDLYNDSDEESDGESAGYTTATPRISGLRGRIRNVKSRPANNQLTIADAENKEDTMVEISKGDYELFQEMRATFTTKSKSGGQPLQAQSTEESKTRSSRSSTTSFKSWSSHRYSHSSK